MSGGAGRRESPGLALTRRYARELAWPALARALGADAERLALGSVGDGSERFGFDDEVSRDHDWGVSLCVWVPDGEDALAGRVRETLVGLPGAFEGWPVLGIHVPCPPGRAGVLSVGGHYRRFTGCARGPETLEEWDDVPEHALAAATNGQVFRDGCGAFTAVRERLLRGYPEPVRLKRVAQRCLDFAQAGQVGLVRALVRGDRAGAWLAYARVTEAACLLAHALERRYCPYYKWALTSCAAGGPLGQEVALMLDFLASNEGPVVRGSAADAQAVTDAVARALLEELCVQGLAAGDSPFLLDHVNAIRARVEPSGLLARRSPKD